MKIIAVKIRVKVSSVQATAEILSVKAVVEEDESRRRRRGRRRRRRIKVIHRVGWAVGPPPIIEPPT